MLVKMKRVAGKATRVICLQLRGIGARRELGKPQGNQYGFAWEKKARTFHTGKMLPGVALCISFITQFECYVLKHIAPSPHNWIEKIKKYTPSCAHVGYAASYY